MVRAPDATEARKRIVMAGHKESEFEGKTLDDAVRLGLDALGLSRAEVMITVLEEGSKGFLGLGGRPYRVRVMPRPGGPPREPAARGEREERGRGGRGRRERGGSRGEGRGEPQRAARGDGRGGDRERGRGGERDRGREGRGGDRERGRGADRERGRTSREPAYAQEPRREEAAPEREPRMTTGREGAESGRERAPFGEGEGRRRRRGRRGGRGRGEERPMAGGPMEVGAVAVAPEGAESLPPPTPSAMMDEGPPREEREFRERPPREEREVRERPGREEREARERPGREEREFRERPRREERGGGGEGRTAGPALPAEELAARARSATEELLRAMGFDARITSRAEGENVDVTAEVADGEDLLTGRKGEVRQALQHLLNLTVNRGEGTRYHLQLEINDFWQRREKELEELARSMADDAVARGGEVLTEYLNAQERRIIHVTLREDPRVKTYAIGDGLIKKLAVAPADQPEASRETD
jgi:predicted RNA-binding protein Jag